MAKNSFWEFREERGEADPVLDILTEAIIGAAIEVHKILGPGLTEKFYEEALCIEFGLRNIPFRRQVPVPVSYKGHHLGETRVDILADEKVIVELKACESLSPVHRAQTICYLQILHQKVGLLINFNVAVLKDGIKRVVATYP